MSAAYGAPPPPPPPFEQRRRRRGGVVWPLLLIFVGAVFLLQNSGYLPSNFWLNLWRLWPLILVLAGLELLLGQRLPWPALAGLGAIVLVLGAVAINTNLPAPARAEVVTRSTRTQLGGANQAAVTVRFGAGQLELASLAQPDAQDLAVMTYEGPSDLAPNPRYTSSSSGVGRLEYQITGRSPAGTLPFGNGHSNSTHLGVDLNPNVPITQLTLQTGAADAHLDISKLRVNSVELSIGAAIASLRLPEAGVTTVHVSGGASTIDVEVPQGVAAQIRHRGGLSTVNVDQTRFPVVNDSLYRSPDYDTAQNKVDLTFETGVSTIRVN